MRELNFLIIIMLSLTSCGGVGGAGLPIRLLEGTWVSECHLSGLAGRYRITALTFRGDSYSFHDDYYSSLDTDCSGLVQVEDTLVGPGSFVLGATQVTDASGSLDARYEEETEYTIFKLEGNQLRIADSSDTADTRPTDFSQSKLYQKL